MWSSAPPDLWSGAFGPRAVSAAWLVGGFQMPLGPPPPYGGGWPTYREAFSRFMRSRRVRHFSRNRVRNFITYPPPLCPTSRQPEM